MKDEFGGREPPCACLVHEEKIWMNDRELMVEFMLDCAGVAIFLVLLWRLTGTVMRSLALLALALAFLYWPHDD